MKFGQYGQRGGRRLRGSCGGGAHGGGSAAISRSGRVQLVTGGPGVHAGPSLVRVPLLQSHHVLQRTSARPVVANTLVAILSTGGRYCVERGDSRTEVCG